jgi:hypothetical protein
MHSSRSAEERASWLLEHMRETPMRRGALPAHANQLKCDIARAIAGEGVPAPLADRVAYQCAIKFERRDLFDAPEWRAMGRMLRDEIAWLKAEAGMKSPRIVTALPKLSAAQIVSFLDELMKTDSRIARTILHAALGTSEPLAMGRRYLADYRLVARKLRALEPAMARTLAAASFTAGVPLHKAMEHLKLRASGAR